jgi:hypothetical protein
MYFTLSNLSTAARGGVAVCVAALLGACSAAPDDEVEATDNALSAGATSEALRQRIRRAKVTSRAEISVSTAGTEWSAVFLFDQTDSRWKAFDGCTENKVGQCTYKKCDVPPSVPLPPDWTPQTQLNVGNVAIGGGAEPVSSQAGADNFYPDQAGTRALWNGGERLTFTWGQQPAISLSAPPRANVQFIKPSAKLDGGEPYLLRWRGQNGDHGSLLRLLVLSTASDNPDAPQESITCEFPLAAQHGAIPAALTQLLPKGAALLHRETLSRYTKQVPSVGNSPARLVTLEASAEPYPHLDTTLAITVD